MSEEPARTGEEAAGRPWGRIAAVVLGIVVAVFVLFTWVFPWVTELGLSPALE